MRTTDLLPLCILSHRFHSLVLRIVNHRLSLAASLRGQTLLFECYHPSARLTQPAWTCSYLGTDGLDDAASHEEDSQDSITPGEQLRNLRELFSRFRPHHDEIIPKVRRRHPAGDIPGSRTFSTNTQAPTHTPDPRESGSPTANTLSTSAGAASFESPAVQSLVSHHVHLDSSELFSQLCARTTVSPRPGMFHTPAVVSDGIIRVWRAWLADQSNLQDIWIKESQEIPEGEHARGGCVVGQ